MPEGLTCLFRHECGIRRQASCKVNGMFAEILCISVCEFVPMGTTAAAVNAWQDSKASEAVIFTSCCMQNLAEDWNLGSTGCYDAVSLARLQMTLKYDFRAVALGNNDACLSQPIPQKTTEHLISETLKADASALGKLMADHTQVRISCKVSTLLSSPLCQLLRSFYHEAVSGSSMHISIRYPQAATMHMGCTKQLEVIQISVFLPSVVTL